MDVHFSFLSCFPDPLIRPFPRICHCKESTFDLLCFAFYIFCRYSPALYMCNTAVIIFPTPLRQCCCWLPPDALQVMGHYSLFYSITSLLNRYKLFYAGYLIILFADRTYDDILAQTFSVNNPCGFQKVPYCFYVCEYQRHHQTPAEVWFNMSTCGVLTTVATREIYRFSCPHHSINLVLYRNGGLNTWLISEFIPVLNENLGIKHISPVP